MTGLVTNPHLYRLNFDPIRNLAPVIQVARSHFVLVAHPALPARRVREALVLARSRPGVVTCAHASGALHLACAWLKLFGRADIYLVPYKGGVQALNDVIGGHVDVTFAVPLPVAPHAQSNRIRVLATTSPRRGSGPFGAFPTVAETLPGFELLSWNGILVPAGTPREIVERLNDEIRSVLDQPETRKHIADMGLAPAHGTPEAFADIIRRDYTKYERITRESGIQAQ